jgi:hypothetical protein
MKKIFYEKVGRRYKPVYEYDQTLLDSFPKGAHLVLVYPGGSSRRYNINPNYAALIAASRVFEDKAASVMLQAQELRLQQKLRETPLTPEQRAAWDHLVEVFGPDARQLEWPSIREIAEKGAQALVDEASEIMYNPSVRQAYEHFELMCELAKDHSNDQS